MQLKFAFDARCCHMGTAVKHPMPDRVKLFCNFWHPGTIAQPWPSECSDVKNYKWT